MPYIRTDKGKLYNLDDLYVTKLKGEPYGVKESGILVYKKNIIKQTDTIDELCDCFIYKKQIFKSCRIIKHNLYGEFEEYIRLEDIGGFFIDIELEECQEVKGAIWTDKGLIYKAEMNDKGELELL